MDQTVQSFIYSIAERIENQCYWTDRLFVNNSVTLRKRFRNLNDSDRYSRFGSAGNWLTGLNTQNLYSIDITQPTIRTNTSAMISANVKIEIEPRFIKDTTAEMAAQVADAIVTQKQRIQWTTILEEVLSQEQQMSPGVFVRTRHNPYLKKQRQVMEWGTEDVEVPGEAVCGECGATSPVSGEVQEMTACAECGGVAVIEKMPGSQPMDVPGGYSSFSAGDSETRAIPFFEVRVDDQNTQGGNLDLAQWFEHHYLASLDELQLEYPESKDEIAGASQDISYSLKWQQVLKRNRIVPDDLVTNTVVEQREVRDIFLTPAMYLNYPAKDDFELKDRDGKLRFSVKAGDTFDKSQFNGKPVEDAPTLCFRLIGTALVDVYIADFKEEFAFMTFLANSSSFWGSFLFSIVSMQDIINYVITLQFYHIRRNAITSIIYNRSAFNQEDFSQDLIPSRETWPASEPIQNSFGIVPALTMSGEPMQMYELIMGSKSDVTLATPALMGQAQPNEPYHAQLLQKQSSLGLLAPSQISKASAKVKSAKQQLRIAQKNWTDEDTEELLKLNPEWSEDFITAFKKCDFDKDLIIEYVEGSEIPQSLIERQVVLQNLLQQVMALGQISPELIKPEMINEILTELTQSSGIQIDINNAEANQRLANSRFDKLLMMLKGIPDTDNMEVIAQVAQQITSLIIFQPVPNEGYDIITEFYSDKMRAEAGKDDPSYLLMACLNNLINLEDEGQVAVAQKKMRMQMEAQAPLMEAQQQEQMDQQQAEGQGHQSAQDQQMEAAQQDRDHQVMMDDRKMAADREARDHQSNEADIQRQHEAGVNALNLLAAEDKNARQNGSAKR